MTMEMTRGGERIIAARWAYTRGTDRQQNDSVFRDEFKLMSGVVNRQKSPHR